MLCRWNCTGPPSGGWTMWSSGKANIVGRHWRPTMLAVNVGSYVAGLNCTVDGRSCCSHSTSHRDICRESRCLLSSPAFDAPVRWIHVGILPMEYLLWKNWNGVAIGLLKILKICLFVSTESTNVTGWQTDRQTDTAQQHSIPLRGKIFFLYFVGHWLLFCVKTTSTNVSRWPRNRKLF